MLATKRPRTISGTDGCAAATTGTGLALHGNPANAHEPVSHVRDIRHIPDACLAGNPPEVGCAIRQARSRLGRLAATLSLRHRDRRRGEERSQHCCRGHTEDPVVQAAVQPQSPLQREEPSDS